VSLGDWAGAIRCERTTLLLDGDDGARSRPTPPGPPPLALAWSAIVGSYDHVSDVNKYGGSAAARGECQEGKRQEARGKRPSESIPFSFGGQEKGGWWKIGPRRDRNRKEGKTRDWAKEEKERKRNGCGSPSPSLVAAVENLQKGLPQMRRRAPTLGLANVMRPVG